MSEKPFSYQYHRRPSDFLNYFCLDCNEYQGEIADSTAKVLQNQKLIQHYPLVDETSLLQENYCSEQGKLGFLADYQCVQHFFHSDPKKIGELLNAGAVLDQCQKDFPFLIGGGSIG